MLYKYFYLFLDEVFIFRVFSVGDEILNDSTGVNFTFIEIVKRGVSIVR